MEWSFCLAHDVVRGDDIVEIGEVVTVKMCDQNTRQKDGQRASSGESHHNCTTCVDQDLSCTGLHQCCWASALGVWHWASCAEQNDFHGVSRIDVVFV
jgi:hypothetical protein